MNHLKIQQDDHVLAERRKHTRHFGDALAGTTRPKGENLFHTLLRDYNDRLLIFVVNVSSFKHQEVTHKLDLIVNRQQNKQR